MTPEAREILRLSLLRYLESNPTKWALNTALLWQMATNEGHRCDRDELKGELQYLADKGLVTTAQKQLSPELRCYRITATGRDYLAEISA